MRAYILGYGFTVGPRVASLLVYHALKLVRGHSKDSTSARPRTSLLEALARIFKAGLELHRFAIFCAALVGGSTLLQV